VLLVCALFLLSFTDRHRLAELPDILVTTPGNLVPHLDKKVNICFFQNHIKSHIRNRYSLLVSHYVPTQTVDLSKLQMIVIDEADLILSFGYKDDIEKIAQHVPKICQGFMMSATLNDDVRT